MMTDRWTGLSRGFGFIQMANDAEAQSAIVALDGTELNGKRLKANLARPQLHRFCPAREAVEDYAAT
jgi:RNA recognition motif-containing protein